MTPREKAKGMILAALQAARPDGVPAATMRRIAERYGVSRLTMHRAKQELGVISRQNLGAQHDGWTWYLPEMEED